MVRYNENTMQTGLVYMKKLLFTLIFITAGANSVLAVDLPHVMKQTMSHDAGMPSLLNLVASMMVVIGLIYLTGWVYSKLNIINREKLNKIGSGKEDNFRFTVLQSMPLGQHRHLYSIKMNGKVLLIGSTPSHVNVLKEFDASIEQVSDKSEAAKMVDEIKEKDIVSDSRTIDIDELYKKYKN